MIVVEVLLFVILFIISPIPALLVLASIAVVEVMYYVVLLMLALAAVVIAHFPVIILGAAIIAAAVIVSTTIVVGVSQFIGNISTYVGQFCASAIQLARDACNAIATFFWIQEAETVVATPVGHDGECHIPYARAYIVAENHVPSCPTHRGAGVRFFDSEDTAPSAPATEYVCSGSGQPHLNLNL